MDNVNPMLIGLSYTEIPAIILYSRMLSHTEKVVLFKIIGRKSMSNLELARDLNLSRRTMERMTGKFKKLGIMDKTGVLGAAALRNLDLDADQRFAPKNGLRFHADKWKHKIETILLWGLDPIEVLVYAHLMHKNLDYWHQQDGTDNGVAKASITEITSALNISRPTVLKTLNSLREKMVIEKLGHKHGIIGVHQDALPFFTSLNAVAHISNQDQQILTCLGYSPDDTWMKELAGVAESLEGDELPYTERAVIRRLR